MQSVSIHLSVEGMTCGACTSTIEKQVFGLYEKQLIAKYNELELKNFECNVALVTEECIVKFDVCAEEEIGKKVSEISEDVVEAIDDCGFDCTLISQTITKPSMTGTSANMSLLFKIGGMTCGACSSTITNQVTELLGDLEANGSINKDSSNSCAVSLVTEECFVTLNIKTKDELSGIADSILECIEDCGFDCTFVSSKNLDEHSAINSSTQRSISLDLHSKINQETINLITRHFESNSDILSFDFSKVSSKALQVKDNSERLASGSFYTLTIVYTISSNTSIRTIINDLSSNFLIESVPKFGNSDAVQQQQLDSLNRTKEIIFWKNSLYISGCIACFCMVVYMFIPMFFNHKEMPSFGPYKLINSKYVKISYINILGLIVASYLQFGPLGLHFWRACKKSLRNFSGTMDTLICLSTFSAYGFSIYSILNITFFAGDSEILFDTSTMLFFFICLGKFLENSARAKTSFVLSKIMTMSPNTALLYKPDTGFSEEILTNMIEIDDVLEIKPGSKIPCDGVVYKGIAEVDEQILTGESTPVTKQEGDKLSHGSINGHGRFLMTAKKVGDDTSLLKLLNILKNAQLSKAPMQEFADRLATRFVPFVVAMSLLSFLFWMYYCKVYGIPTVLLNKKLTEDNDNSTSNYFFETFKIAVSVLIVACPCALGLAAPTSIIVGTGLAAENGILMKNGKILQNFQNIDTFVMDKTGTLTLGKLYVEKFETFDELHSDLTEKDILAMALLVESASEHSAALCIVNYCKEVVGSSETDKYEMTNVETKVGQGVYGEFQDKATGSLITLTIGNKNTLSSESIEMLNRETLSKTSEYAGSNAYISLNSKIIGQFFLNDNLKKDSKDVVYYLTNVMGKEVYMCTGDNRRCAFKFGDELDIPREHIKYEVTPLEKHDLVCSLQEQGKRVVFVGDGINDSLALVKADLGVSILNEGLDVVMESSDVVIMNNTSLVQLIYCIEIATRTFDKIKSNFFWSLIYNVFMLPIAMGLLVPINVTINPIVAGASMALSSVSVVVNSLLIKNWEPTDIEGISTSNLVNVNKRSSFEKIFSWVKQRTSKTNVGKRYHSVTTGEDRMYELA